MNKENCALKLVDEIILYYDARSKKHQITDSFISIMSSVSIILSILCKWKGKIKMDLKEVGCEGVDFFRLLVQN